MKRQNLKTLLALVAVCLVAFIAQAQTNYFRVVNGISHLPVFANTAAVATPLTGMMIYSTDDAKPLMYNGKFWESFNSLNLPVTTGSKPYFNVVNGIPCLPVKASLTGASASGDMYFPTSGGGLVVNSGTAWSKSQAYATTGSPVDATLKMGTSGTLTGGFKLPVLASAPSGISSGAIYISSATKDLMFYTGSGWQQAFWATCAPYAGGVLIEGDLEGFTHLDGAYSYYQKQETAETGTYYKWTLADDALGTNATSVGTAVTWTGFTSALNGKWIKFEVAPQIPGKVYGLAVETPYFRMFACPPQAEALSFAPLNVNYSSVFNFEAGYSYYDREANPEGATITKWYMADDAAGTVNKTLKYTGTPYAYTYATADQNKYLSAAITPVATAGVSPGAEVFTPSFQIVACPPQGYAAIEGDFATCSGPFSVGAYSYYQKNEFAENTGALAYRWFLSTGANGTGATTPLSTSGSYTYTYTAADDGKYLNLGLIVGAVLGYPTSDESISSGLLKNCPPQVSGVMVNGTLTVGQTLTAGYAYYDSEDNAEGTPTYQWYRDNTSTPIAGATGASYTLVAADQGHTVGVAVTVIAGAGNTAGTTANAFTASVP